MEDRAALDKQIFSSMRGAAGATGPQIGSKRTVGATVSGTTIVRVSTKRSSTTATSTTAAAEKDSCNLITQEVIDATIQCMISQADECEKGSLPAYQTERMIMEEMGRCLIEIINFSIRNTDTSLTQG